MANRRESHNLYQTFRLGGILSIDQIVSEQGGDVGYGVVDVERLKARTDAPAVLTSLMRKVCAELELLSTVGAARIGSESSRVKSVGNAPTGETNAYIDTLRERYMDAKDNWTRLQAIGDAQHALELATGNRARTYIDGRRRRSVAWKTAVANDTRSSKVVARDFGCSDVYVRKLRMQYRRVDVDVM